MLFLETKYCLTKGFGGFIYNYNGNIELVYKETCLFMVFLLVDLTPGYAVL